MVTIISKQNLIDDLITENSELPDIQIIKAINTIFDEVSTALVCGDRVELRGFGSLVVRKRTKGVTRNPKSGLKVEVDDRGSLYFRASREFIKALNFESANDN